MDCISHGAPEMKFTPPKLSGEKLLVKAFAAMVNREKNKRTPPKKIQPASSEILYL
jgi:hypothetical protein